jgi:diguanylate cyclase (GGDEF)-like protein
MERPLPLISLRRVIFPALAIGVLTLLIYAGVHAAFSGSITKTLLQSAETAADQWSSYVTENVPDLDELVAGRPLNRYQAYKLKSAVTYADVAGFEIYDPHGGKILSSDMLLGKAPIVGELAREAGQGSIGAGIGPQLVRGARSGSTPDTYVAVFRPIAGAKGEGIGVFRLYVDRTQASKILKDSLRSLQIAVPAACALAYLIPSIAFFLRSRQVRAAREDVRRLEDFDPLTGLLNRMSFSRRLESFFEAPRAPGRGVGLILIDVDDFKGVNEEGGTALGDAYLKFIAGVVLSNTRRCTDLVARTGGDEFLAAIPDITGTDLELTACRIQDAVKVPFFEDGQHVPGHVSVGIHLSLGEESSALALYSAEIALYHAKESGKNALVRYCDGMDRRLKERREVEALIRSAIASDGFQLQFQPIVARGSERIAGFEALVRLPDGKGGMVSPARFIPLAEEVGLINEIGEWVLEHALSAAIAWPEEIMVSVNLSPQQFDRENLVAIVGDMLTRTGFPADRLELEVTETLLLGDDDSVDRQIVGLKQLGVSLAMDDFGTGYSSLGYLLKYGFDKLKIDRSFLEAYEFDPDKHARIIETIIELGHNLGMLVTVEGVEHRHQVELLDRLNCDLLQGFFYGRPMSVEAGLDLISADRQSGSRSLAPDDPPASPDPRRI